MRKASIIIGIVVGVIVVATIILMANLNRIVNSRKDYFLSKAEQALGRSVTIDRIGVSLRGGIGVQLANVTLSDDPAFSDEPFLAAKSIQLNAKLLPLLHKEFELKKVVLREPFVHLIRNDEGELNVNTFKTTEEASTRSGTVYLAQASKQPAPTPLVIALVDIDDGTVRFDDRRTGVGLEVTRIRSRVEDIDLDKPITASLEAALLSETPNLELTATVGPIAQSDPGSTPVEANLKIDPVRITTLTERFPKLSQGLPPDLALDGTVTLQTEAKGQAGALELVTHIDATNADVRMGKTFAKPSGTPLVIDGTVTLGKDKLSIRDSKLAFYKLEAAVSGDVTTGAKPAMNINIKSMPTPMDGWEKILPGVAELGLGGTIELTASLGGPAQPGAKPSVAGTATITDGRARLATLPKPISKIQADIAFTDKTADVRRTTLLVGGSSIEATAKVKGFAPLEVDYRASSPSLALADVKAPNPKAKKPEVMRELVVRGELTVVDSVPKGKGRLTSLGGRFGNFDYEQLKANFTINGKETTLEDIEIRMLDGALKGNGKFVADPAKPTFDIATTAQDINVLELFEALPDVSKQFIRGRANLDVNLAGSGKEWTDIQPTLSGGGLAVMFDGALLDFNVFDSIVQEVTRSTGVTGLISQRVRQKYPKVFNEPNTSFKELKSDFKVEDGKLLARNLNLNAGEYALAAKGGIGFDRSLDLKVTLNVSKALSDDLIADVGLLKYLTNDQGHVEIPFTLGGTMPKVTVVPDPAYVNQVIQKALVKQGVDQLGDQLKKKGLGDLFKGGSKASADSTR